MSCLLHDTSSCGPGTFAESQYGITMFAAHAPALAQVSDLRNTFRSTQGELEVGHV